ncbi:MAG: type II toxin-antitoxin system death-on-curing family toxin [Planctomycetes bacterium]|nr:type II toxin-antitoxin system death-on-curing family toxin [Planctomycetota bacterium]
MTEPPLAPHFLYKHTVLDIHDAQLAEHGGKPGMLDEGLLESALAQPMAEFDGHYLHEDLFAMAAAYVFHLANNHPFVEGNKRTALAAALVFLDINDYEVADEGTELADVVLEMVEQKRDKAWVATKFRRRARAK